MFFEFGIKDIIDIVLVALTLFYVYRLMKESNDARMKVWDGKNPEELTELINQKRRMEEFRRGGKVLHLPFANDSL